MKTYGEAAREMACAVYTVRNYKISNAPLAANAALRMACAVEDGRNYKISHALPSLLTQLVEIDI